MELKRPQGFALGLALGHFALEVDPTIRAWVADLGERGDVDGVVELAIASTRQPMGDPTSRRVLDRGHARIGGEVVLVSEAPDVTGVPDHHAGNDGTHAIDLR